jgi:type IV pilus assembly protein PilE
MTPSTPQTQSSLAGFTFIEVMIVMTIVGLLGVIALPSYTNYVARGHRTAARVQLLQAAMYMQRFYAANDRYDRDRTGGQTIWAVMPPGLLHSPAEGTQVYEIVTTGGNPSTADASTFRLVMRPVPGQTMADDKCGGFTITQAGARGLTLASPSAALIAECWR